MHVKPGQFAGGERAAGHAITRCRSPWYLIVLACLPAFAAYAILYAQASPLPYQDDYHAVLAFAMTYEQTGGVGPRLLAIAAEQHNEYKLGLEHAVLAAELELTRHLNFAFLTAVGDLFLLPMAYLLWRVYRQSGPDSVLAFLPVSFLFFALTYWENLNWAITGLVNTPVIVFSLCAIYLIAPLDRQPPARGRLLAGCIAAALAAFTSANGFLLAPVGLLLFVSAKQYLRALGWSASFLLPLAAYVYKFSSVPHPIGHMAYATRLLFFLGFLGTAAGSRWPAALLGLGILAIIVHAGRSRFDRLNPAAAYFTLWVLLTACLVAWVRGAASFLIGSRYSQYSLLLLIFCYAYLVYALPQHWPGFPRKTFYIGASVTAALFCCAADLHAWKKLAQRREMVSAGMRQYRERPSVNSPMIDPGIVRGFPQELPYERDILTQAIDRGIYTLPAKF